MKLPLASNFKTTLFPASPTNTLPADGPPETPTAMLVGLENWPGPEPGIPAWQLDVQTSLWGLPSATPQPNAAMKVPLGPNAATQALRLCAPYTVPLCARTATPPGALSCPAPDPGLPNVVTALRSDACALPIAAPSVCFKQKTAYEILATRAGPSRTRHLVLSTRTRISVLPATRWETGDGLIESLPPPLWSPVGWQHLDWHVSSSAPQPSLHRWRICQCTFSGSCSGRREGCPACRSF